MNSRQSVGSFSSCTSPASSGVASSFSGSSSNSVRLGDVATTVAAASTVDVSVASRLVAGLGLCRSDLISSMAPLISAPAAVVVFSSAVFSDSV